MSVRGVPWERKDLERESNLSMFRLAHGLTIKELCEKTGMEHAYYPYISTGVMSPMYLTGGLRKGIQEAAELFNCTLPDLFPRYFCEYGEFGIMNTQIIEMGGGPNEECDPADRYDSIERMNLLISCARTERQRDMLSNHMRGGTLEYIGDLHGISRERTRQILNKIYNLFRFHEARTNEYYQEKLNDS